MREWELVWPIGTPRGDCLCDRSRRGTEMVGLCIPAQDKREADPLEMFEYALPPGRRALRPWRVVARAPRSRKAEAHGQDRYPPWIVKCVLIDAHPRSQTNPTRVSERDAGLMNSPAWGLAHDEDCGVRMDLEHGPRAKREVDRADRAGANLTQQCFKIQHHRHTVSSQAVVSPSPNFSGFCSLTVSRP